MNGYPTREEAERLLREGEGRNPGPWGDHSRVAAQCAEKIAAASGLDPQKAYVLGLLHDIGRTFGIHHLGHVYDGYCYMQELGYPAAARICLTHSFCIPVLDVYVGRRDVTEEQEALLQERLSTLEYDDYDRLIQLCDCLADSKGIVDIRARMEDVKRRYGFYPQDKWDTNLHLKDYFEAKAGKDIYTLVRE